MPRGVAGWTTVSGHGAGCSRERGWLQATYPAAICAESSVEPSSTTSSSAGATVWAATDASTPGSQRAPLWLGMTSATSNYWTVTRTGREYPRSYGMLPSRRMRARMR